LLNLTFPTKIKTNYTLEEIFYTSEAKYKLLFENKFVVFSPETFVQIKGSKIFSFPMKGTIDASIENAAEKLLNDPKELAEHNTIVDLIRNDLSIVAKKVRVENFRYIDEVKTFNKTLLQTSSKIIGELERKYNEKLGEIIFSLLPAGSISGAPKKKTVEIIKEAENYDRGYFTGIFGIFDGSNLDSAVMIRFIENINGELYFKSGGGITFMSNPELEYQEMIDKVYVPII
jgi:para-aminobenzoate synthetase component 1